jgi:hypothetical protein
MTSQKVSPDHLLPALRAALQPDETIRRQAEQYIEQAYKRPGCAMALLQIASEGQVDLGASNCLHQELSVPGAR